MKTTTTMTMMMVVMSTTRESSDSARSVELIPSRQNTLDNNNLSERQFAMEMYFKFWKFRWLVNLEMNASSEIIKYAALRKALSNIL